MAYKLLVVEDDLDIASMLRIFLEGEGYEVTLVESGIEAMMLSRHERPDLVISDIMLPDMNGYDVCREIRQSYPHLPIVFLTQKDRRIDRLKGLELGANDYITKPFDIKELQAKVRNLLQPSRIEPGMERNAYKGRILVVEDDFDISTILRTFFSEEGYMVEVASRGQEALEICRKELFDLILLDIRLPDIDGYKVCDRLRHAIRTKNTPLIFLTQNKDRKDRLKALELGADDYVTKPFDIDELQLRVRNLIEQTSYLPFDMETALPSPRVAEEELNNLPDGKDWVVLLLQVKNENYMMDAVSLMMQAQAHFVGRWDDTEFVMILDMDQAKDAYSHFKAAKVPLSIGGVSKRQKPEFDSASDLVEAARTVLK